jgi:hypothetical protein
LAKLIVADKIVKETPVFIPTKGWKGIAEKQPLPVYFSDQDIKRDGIIGVGSTQMAKAFNSGEFTGKWVEFSNMREFAGIDADNFVLETRLQNTAKVDESLCRKVRIVVVGTKNPVMLPLATSGCISDLTIFTGDSLIRGKDHDLSAFGCDFSKQQLLRMQIKDRLFTVSLNNKTILTTLQKTSIGQIVGVRVLFEGPGQITAMTLSSGDSVHYDLMKPNER